MRVYNAGVLAVAIATAALAGQEARGQEFPAKPIRIIVSYAAGGDTPQELGAYLRRDIERYSKVIQAGNVRAE